MAFTLDEAARRIGFYVWLEERTFELLGRWAPNVADLDAKVMLARHSAHHAWHADLWRERLPRLQERDTSRLVAPANEGIERFVDVIDEPTGPDRSVERLAGAYRVLAPRLISAYSAHLAHTSALTDGPTVRCLRLVLADGVEDWREGELTVERLLEAPGALDRAHAQQARAEALLVAAGGILGGR